MKLAQSGLRRIAGGSNVVGSSFEEARLLNKLFRSLRPSLADCAPIVADIAHRVIEVHSAVEERLRWHVLFFVNCRDIVHLHAHCSVELPGREIVGQSDLCKVESSAFYRGKAKSRVAREQLRWDGSGIARYRPPFLHDIGAGIK